MRIRNSNERTCGVHVHALNGKKMKRLLSGVLLSVCCLLSLAQAARQEGTGAMFLLEEIARHRGKVVVLNFFATWCAPCREEIPGLVRLRRQYPTEDLVVLGICLDEDASLVQPFVREYGINYPVKTAGGDIAPMFGVRSVPHNSVYDTDGRLIANAPGFVPEETLRGVINMLLLKRKK
jgi:thiol-disulfide isomerase/thioredoxin